MCCSVEGNRDCQEMVINAIAEWLSQRGQSHLLQSTRFESRITLIIAGQLGIGPNPCSGTLVTIQSRVPTAHLCTAVSSTAAKIHAKAMTIFYLGVG